MADNLSSSLFSLLHIRKEMNRVYSDARTGKMEIGDATKMIYILMSLVKAAEVHNRIFCEEQRYDLELPIENKTF